MTDEASAQASARSTDWAERMRAVEVLAELDTPTGWATIESLLADPDVAVIGAAAGALFGHGRDGWQAVLAVLWFNGDVATAEQIRSRAVDRLMAGEPVEQILDDLSRTGHRGAVRKGARELLMGLGMRPVEFMEDEDDD